MRGHYEGGQVVSDPHLALNEFVSYTFGLFHFPDFSLIAMMINLMIRSGNIEHQIFKI